MPFSRLELAKQWIVSSDRIDVVLADESQPADSMVRLCCDVGVYLAGDVLMLRGTGLKEIRLDNQMIDSVTAGAVILRIAVDGRPTKVTLRMR